MAAASVTRVEFVPAIRSPAVPDERFKVLAELAVHGANIQPGQVVGVTTELGQEELVRAVAVAAYARGAIFVDAPYFDPWVKRERVLHARPDTLDHVPPWLAARMSTLGDRADATITLAGVVAPNALQGVDPALSGRDRLPWVKERGRVISGRLINWTIVPCPHPAWAELVFPDLPPDEAYERLWEQLWHVLRLDEPDPAAAWDERSDALKRSAQLLTEQRFDALELEGPGTELTIGLLPTSTWGGGGFVTRNGLPHLPNIPTEEVFTSPDPARTEGHVTATKPLVLRDGTIVRGLRVRFEGGRAVEVDADENAGAIKTQVASDEGASRLGEVALVDRQGRIGPLGTVFYDTLLDENSASHIAFGHGFAFAVADEDVSRVNDSGIHIDFMIGSPELEVTGMTAAGERVPVLRNGDWQLEQR
jgi:aminopeptidase